jgi:hypothetical protein
VTESAFSQWAQTSNKNLKAGVVVKKTNFATGQNAAFFL